MTVILNENIEIMEKEKNILKLQKNMYMLNLNIKMTHGRGGSQLNIEGLEYH